MEYFSETYTVGGKLCKTKKHFYICPKCGLVQVCPADNSYQYGLCWICFLKSKKYYKSAMQEIKNGWFTWSTKLLELKLSWSFALDVYTAKLFMAILKSPNLNKTPKIPTGATAEDYGFSAWQIRVANIF